MWYIIELEEGEICNIEATNSIKGINLPPKIKTGLYESDTLIVIKDKNLKKLRYLHETIKKVTP